MLFVTTFQKHTKQNNKMPDKKEILEAKAVIDEMLVANFSAIKRIDQEIKSNVKVKNSHEVSKDTEENVVEGG